MTFDSTSTSTLKQQTAAESSGVPTRKEVEPESATAARAERRQGESTANQDFGVGILVSFGRDGVGASRRSQRMIRGAADRRSWSQDVHMYMYILFMYVCTYPLYLCE